MKLKVTDRESAHVTVDDLKEMKRSIQYNSHDFGELGEFIRTSYINAILDKMIHTAGSRPTDGE